MRNPVFILLIGSLLLISMTHRAAAQQSENAPLYFAPLPTSNTKLNIVKSQPIAQYLGKVLQRPVKAKLYQSYDAILKDFTEGKIHFIELGPLPFLKLQSITDNYSPLVSINKQTDTSRYECVLASAIDGLQNLEELTQLHHPKVALTQPMSTCGWLVSNRLLKEQNFDLASQHFEYLGSHSKVALALMRKEFDVGGLARFIAERYQKFGLRILSTSEALPHFTLVSQAEMFTEDEKKIITQSLLNYQPDANNDFRNKGFSPVEMSLFDSFKQRYTAQDTPLKAEHLWQE
ncbi:MAG: PhnD/SsuA/transferrin family substrate-binding protein [Pseudomonadota bacterium]|nr:PhnD/SsuA/transferrin family substrate-binding protein [Pseudomonadota bacterium]